MKKVVVLVVTLLISGLAGTFLVKVGIANPGPYTVGQLSPGGYTVDPPNPVVIGIGSPGNGTSYQGNSVSLRVTLSKMSADICSVSCQLDGQQINRPAGDNIILPLTGLSEGNHILEISVSVQNKLDYVWYSAGDHEWICHYDTAYSEVVYSESVVRFTVDNTSPLISVLFPGNAAYGSAVQLDFMVSEPISRLFYSLDGNGNVSVAGNTTLTGLSVGEHTIVAYAGDAVGNVGVSEMIAFTVDGSEPFPSMPVIGAVVAAVVVCVGVLLYFFKFKKRRAA
jgi:hypothetical protein